MARHSKLTEAFIAANRFGMGPKPGDLNRIARNPKRWLRQQLAARPGLPAALANQPGTAEILTEWLEFRRQRRMSNREMRRAFRRSLRDRFFGEINARTLAMVQSEHTVHERFVAFWANHFTVSARRFFVAPLIGAFEREAIRPHVHGRFEDMLQAAVLHQAMLLYLDNIRSIGPNTFPGLRRKRGLNENLAREVLELHTLGVKGGYTQQDVVEFAKILTGWTIQGLRRRGPLTGKTMFWGLIHEPGSKTLLGKTYPQTGRSEAIHALRDLARHPSTAKHIATRLAQHFIADRPPARAVARLEKTFRRTGGNLAAVYRTLISLPEVWAEPMPKVKAPAHFLVSAFRGMGVMEMPRRKRGYLPFFHVLRQVPFRAPSPKGWPDTAAAWMSPELLMRRVRLARLAGRMAAPRLDPEDIFNNTIAPVTGARETRLILGAETRAEAIALTLASPAFQRR